MILFNLLVASAMVQFAVMHVVDGAPLWKLGVDTFFFVGNLCGAIWGTTR